MGYDVMQALVRCHDCGHVWAADSEIRPGSCMCEEGTVMNWQVLLTDSSITLEVPNNWEQAFNERSEQI